MAVFYIFSVVDNFCLTGERLFSILEKYYS